MRLFVALVPPDDVIAALAEHTTPRREVDERGERQLRWTDEHQWHVTLAFLGAVSGHRLDDVVDALAASAARRDPLVLRLAGADAFPNPYAARVLWAGVEELRGDLRATASAVRAACNGAGATPDGTRFHPHVTLGRFHRPTEATRWIHALDGLETPAWAAHGLRLVESHLGEGRGRRPRYETVAELPLRPSSGPTS